ncbi:MAG: hypothetical protein WDN49_12045 [Acetobacteraceae bacterium]
MAGDRLTLADIPAATTLYRYFGLDIPRPAIPHGRGLVSPADRPSGLPGARHGAVRRYEGAGSISDPTPRLRTAGLRSAMAGPFDVALARGDMSRAVTGAVRRGQEPCSCACVADLDANRRRRVAGWRAPV